MKQIFCFGSSSIYGVGSSVWSWSDMVKWYAHQLMYWEDGIGEKIETFNFGKSWATIDFVQTIYSQYLLNYWRGNAQKLALINVWWNNSKAEWSPLNYVSTPEKYQQELETLLVSMKKDFDKLVFVGSGYVDESKTMPKISPFNGKDSYFSNKRRDVFDEITRTTCWELSIPYIEVQVSVNEWIEQYLYQDGLHPNDKWYEYIFKLMMPYVQEFCNE